MPWLIRVCTVRSGAVSKRVLCVCSETLLDDFMLTHPIFLTADRFQQALLQQYPSHAAAAALSTLSACRLSCGQKLIVVPVALFTSVFRGTETRRLDLRYNGSGTRAGSDIVLPGHCLQVTVEQTEPQKKKIGWRRSVRRRPSGFPIMPGYMAASSYSNRSGSDRTVTPTSTCQVVCCHGDCLFCFPSVNWTSTCSHGRMSRCLQRHLLSAPTLTGRAGAG